MNLSAKDLVHGVIERFFKDHEDFDIESLPSGFTTYHKVLEDGVEYLSTTDPEFILEELSLDAWSMAFAEKLSYHQGGEGFIAWTAVRFLQPRGKIRILVIYSSPESSYPNAFFIDPTTLESTGDYDLEKNMLELYVDTRLSSEDIMLALNEH